MWLNEIGTKYNHHIKILAALTAVEQSGFNIRQCKQKAWLIT